MNILNIWYKFDLFRNNVFLCKFLIIFTKSQISRFNGKSVMNCCLLIVLLHTEKKYNLCMREIYRICISFSRFLQFSANHWKNYIYYFKHSIQFNITALTISCFSVRNTFFYHFFCSKNYISRIFLPARVFPSRNIFTSNFKFFAKKNLSWRHKYAILIIVFLHFFKSNNNWFKSEL